jgi:hypothetical protein
MSTLCRAGRKWQKYAGAGLPAVLSVVVSAVVSTKVEAAAAKEDVATAERNPKNVKNRFLPFFNWNLLPPKPFQLKWGTGIFRIFREILGGIPGGEGQ